MMVVIFGAAVRAGGRPSVTLLCRTEAAFACGGRLAHYLPTGAIGRFPPSEAAVMAKLLQGWGVPRHQIMLEETGVDTLSSARACARLLRGWQGPVRVATSGYHLPRCRLLLGLSGTWAAGCPPPPAPERRWFWRLRECAAMPADLVLVLFRKSVFDR